MYQCILWGIGKQFLQNLNIVKYHESCGQIKVVGVVSDLVDFKQIKEWSVLKKEMLPDLAFELIVVMADRAFEEIRNEAVSMGIEEEKIISYKALHIPDVNLNQYLELLKSPVSIFANNCWGGITYHSLGLPFSSPFINMFLKDEDYIRFLQKPRHYIEKELSLKEEGYNRELKMHYPICECGDICFYFNHYENFASANAQWLKRKRRIKWNNLFVMMFTEKKEIAEQFSHLPYEKKICFVPFASEDKAVCTIDFYRKETPFYAVVNGMASGVYPYYDAMELLCYGRLKKWGDH